MNTKQLDKCHKLHYGKSKLTNTLPTIKYEVVDSKIKVDLKWYKENITSISIPQLKYITKYWEKVKVNKHVVHQFIGVFEDIEKLDLLGDIVSYGGAYNPRFIRGSTTKLSNHSLGLAIDINCEFNKLGEPPAKINETGSVYKLIPIFNKWGFLWGGTFVRLDGMHFEAKYIIT